MKIHSILTAVKNTKIDVRSSVFFQGRNSFLCMVVDNAKFLIIIKYDKELQIILQYNTVYIQRSATHLNYTSFIEENTHDFIIILAKNYVACTYLRVGYLFVIISMVKK